MIYTEEKAASSQEFENLLQRTKEKVKSKLNEIENPSTLSGAEFELIVFNEAEECALGTTFEEKLVHTNDRDFPDIVAAGYFGVEVKATKKNDWTSIGNSVLESSRALDVERIYMFFGKLGGSPDIIYKNYEECLKGIAVTHYPRYLIDMELNAGDSIFSKMGIEYEELRKSENPVKSIRAYYKSKLEPGQELWWLSDDLDVSTTPSPVIKFFSKLPSEEKDKIRAEIFVYVPEILSNNLTKYNRAAAYLASSRGVISSNLRDHFTAGGQVDLTVKGQVIKVPKIFDTLLKLKIHIEKVLESESRESLERHWMKGIDVEDPKSAWLEEIDFQTRAIWKVAKLSEVFQETSG
jgi:hypothetical protein